MPVKDEFVHLHVHTEYSLLDGMCRISDLMARVTDYGMSAVAITDHGNLFGVGEFYREAHSAGVKPIIGSELYVAPESRFDRKAGGSSEAGYHLVLLAENETGYKNLINLSTASYLEGFYYKPRVDKELLDKHCEGLIALSACLGGEVTSKALNGDVSAAEKAACAYRDIFGADNFFIELQDDGMPEQRELIPALVDIARKCGVGIVATNDCHYVDRSDSFAHDVLLCIQTGSTVDQEDRFKFPTDEFYLKPPAEMIERFATLPESIANTVKVARRCAVELQFGQHLLPTYPVPEGHVPTTYLRELVETGLKRRYAEVTSETRERAEHELTIIEQMNYTSYFLIVWDFVNFAKNNNIPVGPGRGSGAGSLVCYALGITELDPLKYGLQFERFLNPARVSPPDFDIDFCYHQRERVINYVRQKYGERNVGQIITFGTMKARAAIRDAGRALNLPYGVVDKVAKLIPAQLNIRLSEALEMAEELRTMTGQPEIARLWKAATAIEGLVRHASVHAAGVVMSGEPLTEHVPLCRAKGDPDEPITTQYEAKFLAKIGLMKIDFLGLRTLTVLDDAVRLVKKNQDIELVLSEIPLDDPETFHLLGDARTLGVFQLESSGMRELAKKIGVERFEEIIALVALFRPGPMHMLDDYVQRKHGQVPIKYDHPALEPILAGTYGVMLYQEQVMKIASVVGGFPLGQADLLRRAMGNKDPEEMARLSEDFLAGAKNNNVPAKAAEKIFNDMAQFAGYGFPQAHSAGYALIAYWTAYLKAHFPLEFMAALLTSEMGNSDKLTVYIDECKRLGIDVQPPDVNESGKGFTVVGDAIRFGLVAVKNVGGATVDAIVEEREEGGKYRSIFDLCTRVDMRYVNRRAVESLVKAGALDGTGAARSRMFAAVERAMDHGQLLQREKQSRQTSLFDLWGKDSALPCDQTLPDVPEWEEAERLANEKEVMGFYVTGHPLGRFQKVIAHLTTATSGSIPSLEEGTAVTVGGIISNLKPRLTRRGDRMAIITLEDLEGSVEVVAYSEAYERSKRTLVEDALVMVTGRFSARNGGARIVADEIVPLDEAPKRLARAVNVRVRADALEESTLHRLDSVLAAHHGDCSLYLHLVTPKYGTVVVRAGIRSRVEPSRSLIEATETVLGESAIWFTAPTHNANRQ